MLLPLLIVAVLAVTFIAKGARRTPQDILAAVARINPKSNPALQPGAPPAPTDGTWCNKFIAWVTAELGAPVPYGEYGTPANAMIAWLAAGNSNWRPATREEATRYALAGKVALAGYFNPGGHGHIALVLPYAEPMRIAQAGRSNFNNGALSDGFGQLPVTFYVHEDEP